MNTESPIVVVGGTGITGRRAVSLLAGRGIPVRAASRSGQTRFVWDERATWEPALAGARALYVVPLDGALLTAPLVELAVRLGVPKIVLLSGRGVDVPGYGEATSPVGATHTQGEAAVRASGVAWTIVRPGWFAQNFTEGFFREAVAAGEIRLPAGDGAVSFVDAADIAEVAVAALTEDGHAGQVYELSGPRALTFAEVAAALSAASGRAIRYVPVDEDAYVAEKIAEGWPVEDARALADTVTPVRKGMDAHISDGVWRALGRPPRDFAEFVRDAGF
ncbi:NAD(P)H-binding protein [Nonomuraea typhae]|uniref:NmrA family NAD(P)-binding protein n=1 Tax=Nonomuraea typhae TaxID=2603600 RepID=UPI001CA5ED6E|nr:NAD(P)H-binding protein [Nonomuraea typhae]